MDINDRSGQPPNEQGAREGSPVSPIEANTRKRHLKVAAVVAAVSAVAGYLIGSWGPRYEFLMLDNRPVVARVDRASGEVSFCYLNEPCMTANERVESDRRNAHAAATAESHDCDVASVTREADSDTTLMTGSSGPHRLRRLSGEEAAAVETELRPQGQASSKD